MHVKRQLGSAAKFVVLAILLVLFLIPFLLLLLNSLKENAMITSNPLALPTSFQFANYSNAFKQMNYLDAFTNTIIITAFSVILIGICGAMTAHYFVRNPSRLNQNTFLFMVASMIIPFQAIMIPLVKIYGSLDMLNSKTSLIFMYLGFGSSLAVFIYHGFIKSIPKELEEAAMIDGCSRIRMFFQIVFPVLVPTTVTIGILNVLWIWNDFLLPSLILVEPGQRTLPLSTFSFYGTYTVDYGPLMASLMLTILPVVIVYLFAQKYIIQGVMQGSVK
ncbi:carbohydrate ABC transporter permease [Paenibacillus graminis]|uniref:Sugar ABC transporter permease n=1 Tax=Paenibacillus graminis TaxID=189425 RepID=A0A089M1C6_9BACL|nr:carbohydrate ABC transporter permease [Paenibacillus graminis]AIQ67541.1 sugar ABC transporter permease [Paenibacillus graminis]MEC0171530.1 carbohydrate ABC transporter permease [Paenibacillus graminis]